MSSFRREILKNSSICALLFLSFSRQSRRLNHVFVCARGSSLCVRCYFSKGIKGMLLLMREREAKKVRLCGVFVVKSKISLSTPRAFFWFFCFSSKTSFGFRSLLFEFFSTTTTTHTCEIHSQSDRRKKKKERREFLSLFLFLLFSLWKRGACAFLVSVVALFRSIDDEEEF